MTDADPYTGREQTKAKHFILKNYLQALSFKVLTFSDVAYVDGFSGPWQTRDEKFTDSSFMIAIEVLKDAQQQLAKRGIQRTIRCFFCERDPEAFEKLRTAVAPFNRPSEGFEIQTYGGRFTDAIQDIQKFVANYFSLIFIDPTGWTGYGFELIQPLLKPRRTEVLINYMFDFINRATAMDDPKTIASFDPILGGAGWNERLDSQIAQRDRGMAVEQLFRHSLKTAGAFDFVVSTKIFRPTIDRPHFFLTYATKSKQGLSTFRDTEYRALKAQALDRASAKERLREAQPNTIDMFAGMSPELHEGHVDDMVAKQISNARNFLVSTLQSHPRIFGDVWVELLQRFVLRLTDIKQLCVQMAKLGSIENTWKIEGRRVPGDTDLIRLTERTDTEGDSKSSLNGVSSR